MSFRSSRLDRRGSPLLFGILATLACGCGERPTEGHVVKGPVAAAALTAHHLDPLAPDLAGEVVAAARSGADGSMRKLEIPASLSGPFVIVSEGGIDISTFQEPVLPTLRTLSVRDPFLAAEPVYATPLTTLTLMLARLVADLEAGHYPGNGDGQITTEELLEAVPVAEAMVRETFGLGLLEGADLFTSPPLLLSTADTEEAQEAALAHRIAVEAFVALLVELREATPDPTGELGLEAVLLGLARDLADGALDATFFGEEISDLPAAPTLLDILSQPPGDRRIPNSWLRVSQLRLQLMLESLFTAPGLRVRWRELSQPELGSVALLVDGDGDGVADPRDSFPDDATEWRDSDADGVGDNADAYPLNEACWAASDGDGSDCFVTLLAGLVDPRIEAGDDGVLYILRRSQADILRFDTGTGHFLSPIELMGAAAPRQIAYSPRHHRLYVAYTDTTITYVEPSRSLTENAFASTSLPINGLASVGDFVLAQDDSGAWESHYIFDRNGNQTDWEEWNQYSRVYAWNQTNSRVYFFRDTQSPNDLMWEEVDQTTGIITRDGESPYHGDFSIQPPITVSGDGLSVMLGSGDIYDASSLRVDGSIPTTHTHAVWPDGEGPITLSSLGIGSTLLERRDAGRRVAEYLVYAGKALGLFQLGDRFFVVLESAGRWHFLAYVPSDDTDGDRVENLADAFPLDPAASADRDADGHPDAWNPGYGAADSTQGLVLDSYPDDSACYLPEHGDGTICDIEARLPSYDPDAIVADETGTLYLLARGESRVFRWSAVDGEHLNPLVVGSSGSVARSAPAVMAWSEAHQRLYLGYQSGALTYVPSDESRERAFASTAMPVQGLASVGDFVLAQDDSGAWESHYIFDGGGNQTDWVDWNHYSRVYEWSETNSRVYFFRDGTYPNDLHWEEVDQTTGTITDAGETPYHGSYAILPPIRVSRDGMRVLLGSGDVYDGLSLEILDSLPIPLVDAVWLEDGSLVTIREGDADRTLLEQWSADLVLYNVQSYEGTPLRVLTTGDQIVVVTHDGERPAFSYYVPTDDGDGDGVVNWEDAFPLDPAASRDSDGDGYPDAWNPGMGPEDSTEGLSLDAFPLDSACQLPEHALPDQPDVCDIAYGIPAYVPGDIVVDDDGVIHLLSPENDRIFRWSPATGYHLNPLITGDEPAHLAYSSENQKLYLAYESGAITQFDLATAPARESAFAATPTRTTGLQTAGRFVFAIDPSGAWNTHYTFAPDGTQISALEWNRYSRSITWSAANNRMYFFRDGTSPNDLHWESIDPTTGEITDAGETPYHGGFAMVPPIRVSPDGSRVLLGSGDIFDGTSMLFVESMPIDLVDAVWLADGSLVTIREEGRRTLLEQWRSDLSLYNVAYFDGKPLRVVVADDAIVVITLRGGQPAFAFYLPTGDGDGDGILNWEDAFPLDPAASQDSDGDGYPDAWNAGMGEADSTTGLMLDAFPLDSACQLPGHALPGQPDVCDIANGIPDYEPERIVVDGDGVIYLLSPENDSLYRWSMVTGRHLNPLVVGDYPRLLTYSPADRRLYLGYESGAITMLDPDDPGSGEQSFATTAEATRGLASVGDFVLAQDDTGAWESHYIFDRDGHQTDWREWNHYSRVYAWSEANSRVYFFRDTTSPNDLMWEEVDQVTGTITADGETPYHGSYAILPPIRVSPDGARVILGSGDIYDGLSLQIVDSLPIALTDAVWLADGSLVTIRESGDGRTVLEHWSPDLALYNLRYFDGLPIRVVAQGDAIVVITSRDGQPAFSFYVPTDDADADGVVNSEDAFPLDPAASRDSDADGYPDAWNPGMGPEDSSEGLTLDAFPLDSACQLPEHALPGQPDVCDIANGIPAYEPERVVADGDGVIYLLSPENDRIFRWSIDAAYHLNPLVVGDDPRLLSYSPAHQRLYLGYQSGAITMLDLADPGSGEQAFATTAQATYGLASVGDYVLAQDNSGAWESHYIFDRNGNQTDWVEWNHYSRVYAWSEANSRVYFFRDGSSPNDLHWEEVDQATGSITAQGETPYHGKYAILPPIRVSPDGARVILGSGDVYDGLSLEWLDSLPQRYVDMAWLADGSLVTIRETPDGRTLLEQWSEALALCNMREFDGPPVGVVTSGQDIVVITEQAGRPAFAPYVPSNDGDGDGVVNDEDAFPIDPAASLDSDRDGYPDGWNAGMSAADSTTGLVLDAFPDDFACQLPEHGAGGLCDFQQVLPIRYDEPFCGSDAPLGAGSSGYANLPATSDFVPLCDGWMLLGDTSHDRIVIHNVIEDRQGALYDLGSRPGDLELDENAKLLYVALPDQLDLGVLDLISGELSILPLGIEITTLSLGSAGDLFLLAGTSSSYSNDLYWLVSGAALAEGPWSVPGRLLRYNAVRDELVIADGSSSVRRYAFTPAAGPVLLQAASAGNAGDLAISGDGLHVAVASGGGNGADYTMFDFDAANLANVRGEWAVGAYPRGAGFDSASARVVASNYSAVLVFDVDTFEELDRYTPGSCSYGTLRRVAFSRGDGLVFGAKTCGFDGDSTRIDWFVPGP